MNQLYWRPANGIINLSVVRNSLRDVTAPTSSAVLAAWTTASVASVAYVASAAWLATACYFFHFNVATDVHKAPQMSIWMFPCSTSPIGYSHGAVVIGSTSMDTFILYYIFTRGR